MAMTTMGRSSSRKFAVRRRPDIVCSGSEDLTVRLGIRPAAASFPITYPAVGVMISVKIRLGEFSGAGRIHSLRASPCTRSRLSVRSDTPVLGLVGSETEYDSPGSNCSKVAFRLIVFSLSPPIAAYAALTRSCGPAAGTAHEISRLIIAPIATAQHNDTVKYGILFLLRIEVPPLNS